MPSSSRRGRGRPPAAKSAETRARIVDAAREVFCDAGYAAATFQEMAVRADLTRPAINHYFPTKAELYREVMRQTYRSVIAAGLDEARRVDTLTGRLQAFLAAVVGDQHRDRSAAAFVVTSVLDSHRHPELCLDDYEVVQSLRDFSQWILKDAVAQGELPDDIDIDLAGELLVAMLCGLGLYAGFIGDRDRLGDVAASVVRMLHWQAPANNAEPASLS